MVPLGFRRRVSLATSETRGKYLGAANLVKASSEAWRRAKQPRVRLTQHNKELSPRAMREFKAAKGLHPVLHRLDKPVEVFKGFPREQQGHYIIREFPNIVRPLDMLIMQAQEGQVDTPAKHHLDTAGQLDLDPMEHIIIKPHMDSPEVPCLCMLEV